MLVKSFIRIAFLAATVLPVCAEDSVSAGGRWIRMQHKDANTGAISASYVLTGETTDYERHPTFVLSCSGNKAPVLTYDTDTGLSEQAHDVKNFYTGAIWVLVKVDNAKVYRTFWDIIHDSDHGDRKAIVDRKTMHALVTGKELRLRFRDNQDESHLDEFVLSGLDVNELRETCGSKWFGKANTKMAAQGSPSVSRAEINRSE